MIGLIAQSLLPAGIASSSLHGWVWFVSALAGTVAGVKLRPLFGLPVERR